MVLSIRVSMSMLLKVEPSLANRMTTAAALQRCSRRRLRLCQGLKGGSWSEKAACATQRVSTSCHMLKGVVEASSFQAVFRLGAPSGFSVMCRARLIFGYNARATHTGTEEAKWYFVVGTFVLLLGIRHHEPSRPAPSSQNSRVPHLS